MAFIEANKINFLEGESPTLSVNKSQPLWAGKCPAYKKVYPNTGLTP